VTLLERMRRTWQRYHLARPEFAFLLEPPPPNEWVAIDCETTGLNRRTDEIIAIGAVRIVGQRILTSQRLELLVRARQGGARGQRAHPPPAQP
jgi:DNA polymerase-3 subunit epsilon